MSEAMTIQMQSETAQSAANGKTEFISFAIGGDHYGVDIMAVREIKGCSEINQLPNQPDYIRGVINLRGVIAPAGLPCPPWFTRSSRCAL